jgi:YgiT-type zinc finger domain-containing protein
LASLIISSYINEVKNEVFNMICTSCGKSGAVIRHITRSYGKGEELFVIENIPAVFCQSCGEHYLTAETQHEIKKMKLNPHDFAEQRQVAVAVFA